MYLNESFDDFYKIFTDCSKNNVAFFDEQHNTYILFKLVTQLSIMHIAIRIVVFVSKNMLF